MKLKLYQPGEVGYLSLDPYEYQYDAADFYPDIDEILRSQRTYRVYDAATNDPEADGMTKLGPGDGQEYLEHISKLVLRKGMWDTEIVDNG